MPITPHRRLRAAVLSAAVVLLPAAASCTLAVGGVRAGRAALAGSDPAGALLALSCLVLAGVLVWGSVVALAGVTEAWSRATPRPAVPPAPGTGSRSASWTALRAGHGPTPGPSARGRSAAVSAGVAALVVAALTGPTATAAPSAALPGASGPSAAPAAVVLHLGGPAGTATPPSTDPDDAPAPPAGSPTTAAAAVPGSWSALAEDGFRAPRGASLAAASLVTAQPTRPAPPPVAEVVVMAGDSLWSIAARHLGPGADATEVADAWPAWWEANRAVVGDDPDLLLPGQRLVAPTR